jgi:hypothetical protein
MSKREDTGKNLAKAFNVKAGGRKQYEGEFGGVAWAREKRKQQPITPVAKSEELAKNLAAPFIKGSKYLGKVEAIPPVKDREAVAKALAKRALTLTDPRIDTSLGTVVSSAKLNEIKEAAKRKFKPDIPQ